MSKAMRQMLGQPGRVGVAHGEAMRDPISDEAGDPPREHLAKGLAKQLVGTGGLLEAALTRQNLQLAWKRVKANKGAAGVDGGLDMEQTQLMLRTKWPDILLALLAGSYRPSPVRKVLIPKPDSSQRELGIPTVTDRLIQQALLQVRQPLIDPSFSEHSHGFRPGRRAHDAVKAARQPPSVGSPLPRTPAACSGVNKYKLVSAVDVELRLSATTEGGCSFSIIRSPQQSVDVPAGCANHEDPTDEAEVRVRNLIADIWS